MAISFILNYYVNGKNEIHFPGGRSAMIKCCRCGQEISEYIETKGAVIEQDGERIKCLLVVCTNCYVEQCKDVINGLINRGLM